LGEEVVDDGEEGDGEDVEVLGLLLFEIGKESLVFDVDGFDFFALAGCPFELIDLDFPLIH